MRLFADFLTEQPSKRGRVCSSPDQSRYNLRSENNKSEALGMELAYGLFSKTYRPMWAGCIGPDTVSARLRSEKLFTVNLEVG